MRRAIPSRTASDAHREADSDPACFVIAMAGGGAPRIGGAVIRSNLQGSGSVFDKFMAIAACTGLLLMPPANAQPASEAAPRWRAQMNAAEEADFDPALLKGALETAEGFGESDLRLFETLVRLAEACQDEDNECDPAKAGYLDRALRIRSRVQPAGEPYAALLMTLGGAIPVTTRHHDALAVYGEALTLREQMLGPSDAKVAETLVAIAWVHHWRKNPGLAREFANRALDLREKAGAAQTEGFAELLDESAELYLRNQDRTNGRKEYARATAIRGKLRRQTDLRYIDALTNIASNTRWGEDQDLAEQTLRDIIDLQKRAHTERSEEYFDATSDLGYFLQYQRRLPEAQAAFELAYRTKERLGGKDLPAAGVLGQIAQTMLDRGLYGQAAEMAEKALAIRTARESTSSYGVVSLYALLAEAYLQAREETKSEVNFTELSTAAVPDNRETLIDAADKLAKIYIERGDRPNAARKLETLVAALEAGDPNDKRLLVELPRLAQLYTSMGRVEDANRMNMAMLRMAGGTLRDAVNSSPETLKRTMLILTIVALSPIFVFCGCGGAYWWFARRLHRKLAVLETAPVGSAMVQETAAALAGPPRNEFLSRATRLEPAALVMEPTPEAVATAVAEAPPEAAPEAMPSAAPEEAPEAAPGAAPDATPEANLEATAEAVPVAAFDGGVLPAPPLENMPPAEPPPIELEAIVAPPTLETEPPPLALSQPPPLPASQISLLADGSELFAMRVLNLLLSLLTLGGYSFWGKAKVRRYVCGQAEYLGDRFAFHGTGRELLRGWMRSLPALGFIFLVPNIVPLFWQHPYSIVAAQIAAFAALAILWPVARIGAYRYRMNRMSWRGIRFSYRGKAMPYLGASLLGYLITVLTLGIYWPFVQNRLRKALYNKTYFGDGDFHFSGRGRDLLPAWLFALPLTMFSFGVAWAWWSALRQRYFWAHTTFAGSRFRCTATGAQLLGLWIVNFLIIVPTLGLGMSWVMLRTLRFWTEHLEIVQTPDLSGFRQDEYATSAVGESYADFLGFDFGF